ncbi:CBS domain-containing protein [Kitasatospora purpeofusca]|uniref:CBS domain-containing protein n=1 Tax=Kitasatospora purpeofusca TaxID=67352 RepID=UPI0032553E07
MPTDQDLQNLQGKTLTVEKLLGLFQATARDQAVVMQVRAALAAVSLTTVPSFATANLFAEVAVVPLAAPAASGGGDDEDATTSGLQEQPLHPPMVVGALPASRAGLDSVEPGTPLIQATMRMMTRRVGQLPVVDGFAKLCGVVTWESIAAMRARGVQGTVVEDAFERGEIPEVGWQDKLLPAMDRVREHGYVMVRSPLGHFSGIITRADLAERFGIFAAPFYVIGEIERTLRDGVHRRFTDEDVKQSTAHANAIDQLTMGAYWHFFKSQGIWEQLGWPEVPMEQFLADLNAVVDIRNAVMHFDPTPLAPRKMRRLEEFAGLLRALHF